MFRILRIRPSRAAATLAILAAAPAGAQSIPSPYRFIEEGQEAGAFVSYLSTDAGRFGFGPRSGITMGIRYGLELAGPIGLEGVATLAPLKRDVVGPGSVGGAPLEEAETALVFIEARLRFALTGRRTWRGMQPFVYAGAGVGFDARGSQSEDQLLTDVDRFDFGTKFVGSAGAGTRIVLPGPFVLRLDAGLLLYQLKTPSGFEDPVWDLGEVPDSEWVTGKTFSLGFAYRF